MAKKKAGKKKSTIKKEEPLDSPILSYLEEEGYTLIGSEYHNDEQIVTLEETEGGIMVRQHTPLPRSKKKLVGITFHKNSTKQFKLPQIP